MLLHLFHFPILVPVSSGCRSQSNKYSISSVLICVLFLMLCAPFSSWAIWCSFHEKMVFIWVFWPMLSAALYISFAYDNIGALFRPIPVRVMRNPFNFVVHCLYTFFLFDLQGNCKNSCSLNRFLFLFLVRMTIFLT